MEVALLDTIMHAVLRIWIRNPVPLWPQDPGSGMGKKSRSGSGMNILNHISESLETIFWDKILKFFEAEADTDPGIFMTLDPGWTSRIRNTKCMTLHQHQSNMRSDLTCSLSVALMRMFFSLTFSQIISGQSFVFSTTRRLPVVRITSLRNDEVRICGKKISLVKVRKNLHTRRLDYVWFIHLKQLAIFRFKSIGGFFATFIHRITALLAP
jgi:hypothetical protein